MRRLRISLLILGACILSGSVASVAGAMPIVGEIGFLGSYEGVGGASIATFTGFEFPDASTFQVVGAATGNFAPLIGLSGNFFFDFTFAPFPGAGITPLWEIVLPGPTIGFDLFSLSVDLQDADNLALSGAGTLFWTGFDDTPGTWSMSADSQGSTFLFTSATADVPEPGAVALFAISLLVAGASLRGNRRSS